MKFKLPFLLLLSLMWQGAVWGAEWADLATAVTVTEGYLCAGEAALDGTGTDVKCDDSNPYIDDDGNIGIGTVSPANSLTVVGDISATTINATQLCDENGANCTTLSGGLSGVSALASLTDVSATDPATGSILRYDGTSWTAVADLMTAISTTTMVAGFPDAIICGAGTEKVMLFHSYITSSNVHRYIRDKDDSGRWVSFNNDGTYNASDDNPSGLMSGDSDCVGSTIGSLYSAGKAFNFLGNNGAQTSLTEIADVSASTPSEGEVLSWNNSSGRWEPSATASAIDALGDIGDVSSTAAGDGQVLAWDNANSEWAPKNAQEASVFSCPAGFTLMQNQGQTLGCIQDTANSTTTCNGAIEACYTNYGGVLTSYGILRAAVANSMISISSHMWTDDASYSSNYRCGIYNSADRPSHAAYTDSLGYHCFIPASGQISITTVAALSDVSASAPTEGQVLSYDASEGEWVASDASAGVSALASLTDVSATDAATGSILRYDGTSWTAVADLMTAISTTTMGVGWPDAIYCRRTAGDWSYFNLNWALHSDGTYRYTNSADHQIRYNSDRTYNTNSSFAPHASFGGCDVSIDTLYSEGRAFNFLGNNGAQTSMTEIADVSASAPTDGQLLSYDASENEWVATDVISKTIIYNSIDEEPCVVTGGVHKLSFNPTTGQLRICRP